MTCKVTFHFCARIAARGPYRLWTQIGCSVAVVSSCVIRCIWVLAIGPRSYRPIQCVFTSSNQSALWSVCDRFPTRQGTRDWQNLFAFERFCRTTPTGKAVNIRRWTSFFETFAVGPNRSTEFWTEILVEWIAPIISRFFSHIFGDRKSFVISRTSLYGGSLYRGSTSMSMS